jgi:4-hydroxybenzoate polyprenyltransferase
MKLSSYIQEMRPRQWFKSFYLIFGAAPAIFLLPSSLYMVSLLLILAIINLILVQGAMYVINDIADAEKDRKHPTKKLRPIASGAIGIKEAYVFAAVLLAAAFLLGLALNPLIFIIDIFLFLNNIAYSFKPRLKDMKYVDIASVAFNFPLRVMVGWYLFEPFNQARFSLNFNIISSVISPDTMQALLFNAPPRVIEMSVKFSSVTASGISIIFLSYFLAVFLLSMKRIAEKRDANIGKLRKVLKDYSIPQLKAISILSALASIALFAVFALSLKPLLVFLTPIFAYMVRWYYRLGFEKDSPVKEPEKIFTKSPKFIAACIIILILSGIILFL